MRTTFEIDVPGAEAASITVEFKGNKLIVFVERVGGSAIDRFNVPRREYNAPAATATLTNGVLTIDVPKMSKQGDVNIPVTG